MDHPQTLQINSPKGCLVSISLILVGIVALVLLVNALVDNACARGARNWLPYYPGAEVISEDYTFVRMWGIGTSQQVLYSTDDLDTVEDWYQDWNRQQGLAFADRGGAQMAWNVDEADSGGTTITLRSQCARSLDLSPIGIGNAG